uniref:Protein CutA n=1 Tax=Equus caballus TaxID=9796 RepID=A0A5F5PYG9_HORSE
VRLCLRLLPPPDSSLRSPTPPSLQPGPPSALSPPLSGAREPARPPYHARRGAAPPPARRLCVSAVCCGWTRSSGPGSEGGVSRGCGGVSDLTGPGRPSSFPPPPRKDEPPFPPGLPTFCPSTLFKCLWIRLSIGQISPALLPQQEAGQAGPREGRDWLALEARGSPVSTVTWCALFSYHVPAAQVRRGRCSWVWGPFSALRVAFDIQPSSSSIGCMRRGRASAILLGGGAALLLSLLWMPVLLPGASRLLLLPRALLSMASGSPPSQPSQASGSGYVPGSVSAAFVTCPNEKVAKEIARAVVEKHLAACVNLIPKITSIYEWKGKIEEDSEVLMMIKTQSSLVPALTDFVRSVHPYEVAEVIALPVEQGNIPYLNWVRQVTVISDSSTVQP